MTAQAKAPSVPGRGAKCSAALSAVRVRRGSTTISGALVLAIRFISGNWVTAGSAPHTTIKSDCSISPNPTPILAPVPAVQPAPAWVEHRVLRAADHPAARPNRARPEDCTSPIVP